MQGFAYFPAIVYRDERPDLVEEIAGACARHLDAACQSDPRMRQSEDVKADPAFQRVCDYLLLTSVGLLREQGYAVDQYDFYLKSVWAQEVGAGSGTNVHVHTNSQISGWFFVDVVESGAYPVYYDTRFNKAMIELDFVQGHEVTNATNTIHFSNMQPGTVMFSNSWMQHQLVGGASDKPTRCLHFIVSHRDKPCSMC